MAKRNYPPEMSRKWRRTYREKHPWYYHLAHIRQRCENRRNVSYHYYGAKGIKCLLTVDQMEIVWKRDNAHLLTRPSIDRIDPNGHYELGNVRFIELSENSRRLTHAMTNGQREKIKQQSALCPACAVNARKRWMAEQERDIWKEKAIAEQTKREEAERAIRQLLPHCAHCDGKGIARGYANVKEQIAGPGPLVASDIPCAVCGPIRLSFLTPAKKSQEKPQ